MFDVHVIGGGPSGTISAITAARMGMNVLLSEEHARSGLCISCSGLFSKEGLEQLKDFVDYRRIAINRINGATISLGGEEFAVTPNGDIAYVCPREEFDYELALKAESEGVKIEYGKRVGSDYKADGIIGADGPLSTVARNFSFPQIGKFVTTLQGIVKYGCYDKNKVEVYIDNARFPGFFGWIIPQNEEYAEFGIGTEIGNSPKKAFEELLKMKNAGNYTNLKGAVIPIRWRKRTGKTTGRKKVMLVGDAAGQVKATTGGGVMFGSKCARIAGRHTDNPYFYENEWKARYGMDLLIHNKVQEYLAKRTNEELREIAKTILRFGIDEYLSKNGHMDRPTKMIRPAIILHMLKGFINLRIR